LLTSLMVPPSLKVIIDWNGFAPFWVAGTSASQVPTMSFEDVSWAKVAVTMAVIMLAAKSPLVTRLVMYRFFTKHSPSPPEGSHDGAGEIAARRDRCWSVGYTETLVNTWHAC
jgi:hypothetical protein